MIEANANSPTISSSIPGYGVLVTPNTMQQGLPTGLDTQPVAFNQLQTPIQSLGNPVGATMYPQTMGKV